MYFQSFLNVFVPASLLVTALFGLLAIVSPRMFGRISARLGGWVDSAKALVVFDKQFAVDDYILRHSRLLHLMVVASVCCLWFLWLGG